MYGDRQDMALWRSLYFELCAYGHTDVMNAMRDFWIIPHENRSHPRSTRSNMIEAALHRRYKFADDTTTRKPSELGVLPVRSMYSAFGLISIAAPSLPSHFSRAARAQSARSIPLSDCFHLHAVVARRSRPLSNE